MCRWCAVFSFGSRFFNSSIWNRTFVFTIYLELGVLFKWNSISCPIKIGLLEALLKYLTRERCTKSDNAANAANVGRLYIAWFTTTDDRPGTRSSVHPSFTRRTPERFTVVFDPFPRETEINVILKIDDDFFKSIYVEFGRVFKIR